MDCWRSYFKAVTDLVMFRVHDSYHFYDNTGSLGYVLYHALPPGGLYAINLANLSIENVCP